MEAKAAQGKNQGEKDTGANVKKESSPTKNAEDGTSGKGDAVGSITAAAVVEGVGEVMLKTEGEVVVEGVTAWPWRTERESDGIQRGPVRYDGWQNVHVWWNANDDGTERKEKVYGRCRLFVGNITQDMTEEDFKEMFTPYGECGEIFLNGSKGFGFVRLVRMKLASVRRPRTQLTKVKIEISVRGRRTEDSMKLNSFFLESAVL